MNPNQWKVSISLVCFTILFMSILLLDRTLKSQTITCRFQCPFAQFPYRSGDILLNKSGVVTRLFTKSLWGHIAMVVQHPHTGLFYVWETQIPVQGAWWSMTTSLKSRGTRLTPLFRYLTRMKKPICVRSLLHDGQPAHIDASVLFDFIEKKWNQPFAFDFLVNGANRVFMDLVNVPALVPGKRTARYCAELIAETLAHLGIMEDHPEVNKSLLPRDFSQGNEVNLPLKPGWSFGDEVLLTFQ
jgi:hypothetical protein